MKVKSIVLIAFFLTLLFTNQASGEIITARANGFWNVASNWDLLRVPNANDTVRIDGKMIMIKSAVSVKMIILSNTNNAFTQLLIKGENIVNVSGDIEASSGVNNNTVEFQVSEKAILNVGGDVTFTREATNMHAQRLFFQMHGGSETNISGDFSYFYDNADGESTPEILMTDSASLEVIGKTILQIKDGNDLEFSLQNKSNFVLRDSLKLLLDKGNSLLMSVDHESKLDLIGNAYLLNNKGTLTTKLQAGISGGEIAISGNIELDSKNDKAQVMLESSGFNSQIDVGGDIEMRAIADSSSIISISNNAKLYLGGSINRPTNFGALEMLTGAKMIYNGDNAQSIASSKLSNAGMDSLYYSDISFKNTSSNPIALEGDVLVKETLTLSGSVIRTSDLALLIIDDQAEVIGGDETAFVHGPMKKKGRTNGQPFTFPLGDDGVFAPLTITASNSVNSEYIARFYSDPPPFGGNLTDTLKEISNDRYWEFTATDNSTEVVITLHWSDLYDLVGNEIQEIVVTKLGDSDIWLDYGNAGMTGGTGVGESGSITSLLSDPPPFGGQKLSIAIRNSSALPVELSQFNAVQQNNDVLLEWETQSEKNNEGFIIQHSADGYSFKDLGMVTSANNSDIKQYYSFKDYAPVEGANYYRLKIMDKDGQFEYSDIEIVRFDKTPALNIYPNPVKELIHIKGIDVGVRDNILEVFDRSGKQLFMGKVTSENGEIQINTDAININEIGSYLIRISNEKNTHILKIVKSIR